MAETIIGVGDPKAVKHWSANLARQVARKGYFSRKFVGTSDNAVIQKKTDLESDAGDTISYDLVMEFQGEPTAGDQRRDGLEENLRFYSDEVTIDQLRHSATPGGRMTRKRTLHNLREVTRDREAQYWARYFDQVMFIYLSGARGINRFPGIPTSYTGHAGNAIQAPDSGHILYGGTATSKASLAAGDKMSRMLIERAETYAYMLQEIDGESVAMQPVEVEGEPHFIVLMSPYAEHDLRTASTAAGEWFDIQKAAATAEGKANPIFKGSLGMIKNVVLHKHENAIRFNDYGAGANVQAARSLLLGRQAGVVAYGTAGGMSYQWEEELKDGKNQLVIYCGTIFGIKKTRYNNRDFGVIALDTAAAQVS